jgi:hypothetical protein
VIDESIRPVEGDAALDAAAQTNVRPEAGGSR